MTVIRLTTNQDLNKDVNVRFSITGGADKDEFEILPDENWIMLFR
jgi:hypothetical protein